jgi:hypothetical protein
MLLVVLTLTRAEEGGRIGCALQLPQGAAPFVDPGVTAVDDTDGDVSHAVMRYGLGAVDTAVATPDDAPYVITYAVTDSAGNAAAPVRRRVYVLDTCGPLGGGLPNPYCLSSL